MALIRQVAEGESAEAWASELAGDWHARAQALKFEAGAGVWRAPLAGRDVVVKTWPLAGRRRAQSMLTLSPAWRHWRTARRLAAAGFDTARPLTIATVEIDAALAEALVLEALEGPTALEVLARPTDAATEAAVARAIGAQVRALSGAGWYNRDHKPSNLIVARASRDSAQVAMIDCVGFRRTPAGSEDHLARMLAKLLIEPVGCGLPVRRSLRWRVLAAATGIARDGRRGGEARAPMRRLWERIERIVAEHGDPTPKVDPLKRAPSASSGRGGR